MSNLGGPRRLTELESALLESAGLGGNVMLENLRREAERTGAFADKARYFQALGDAAASTAEPVRQQGASMPQQQPGTSQPTPAQLIEQSYTDAQKRRETDRAANAAAAMARDPRQEFLDRHFNYPLPPDAASKLGNDPSHWNEEAQRLSLQHRWDNKMPMNPTETLTLGVLQSTDSRVR